MNFRRKILNIGRYIIENARAVVGPELKGSDVSEKSLIQLPGTPYSAYNIPIEYLPSRDYRARWGNGSVAPIRWMMDQFFRHRAVFESGIAEMNVVSASMTEIPEEFSHEGLPMPGWYGVAYCPFDAVALAMMLVRYKPKIFLEIGSGISTCFARYAINKFGLDTKIISIDPDPRAEIDNICDDVIRSSLESCDLSIFDQLEANDILFLDGSHRAFMNSDVTVFFGDIIPRIRPGTVIHIHDINLPYDYPESFKQWYWNEQYVLMALFLGAGSKITPLFPTSYICRDEKLMAGFKPAVELVNKDGWYGGGAMWFTLNERLG
jgi:predicted O-methyltransferase YrrM